jgi:hypothetical protein
LKFSDIDNVKLRLQPVNERLRVQPSMCPAHSNSKPVVSSITTNKKQPVCTVSPPAVDFAVRFTLKSPTASMCLYWF